MSATTASGSSSIDNDIAQWVSDAGYGQVKSSSHSGSSDWASFRKVRFNCVDLYLYLVSSISMFSSLYTTVLTYELPCVVVTAGGNKNKTKQKQVEVTNPPTPETSFFVKVSQRSAKDMFEGEALGLQAMYECSNAGRNTSDNNNDDKNESLCIPKVFHWGDSSSSSSGSFLIMEYLVLKGRSNEYALGRAMAKLHLADPTTVPKAGNPDGKFGFNVDNTIGGTVQPNPWTDNNTTQDWIDFYSTHRIQHQLQLAGDASLLRMWTNDIAPRLPVLFENLEVKPSLLHGDLWSGNIGSAKNGIPSIYDPAVYWGHHEAEWGKLKIVL